MCEIAELGVTPIEGRSARPAGRGAGGPCLVALLLLGAVVTPGWPAQEPEPGSAEGARQQVAQAVASLPLRYREWIQTVAGLMTQAELDYFLSLEQDYRRDQFMEKFWEPRDPDPTTRVNELRVRWQNYLDTAGGLPYGDPRFVVFLLNGPPGRWSLPDGRGVGRCFSRTNELEIWFYDGSERTARKFLIIFQKLSRQVPYEVYYPGASLRPVKRAGGLPTQDIRLLCADEVLRYALSELSFVGDYEKLVQEVMTPPLPSPEWLASLRTSSTDVPAGAETFAVRAEILFPGRNQSRTAMQVVLVVPLAEAPGRRFDGELFHNFQLVGEVIRDDRLFEDFRYGFEGPTPEGAAEIPVGLTRYLRPGLVTLRILVEDVFSGRFAQIVREVEIPSPDGLPSVREAELEPVRAAGPSLELLPPPGNVLAGVVRFNTRFSGEFDRVAFFVDDEQVLSKRSPPYSVELDLGEVPEPHRVRVVGFAEGGGEVATDQIWLNQGSQRFRVHLLEPRTGGIYPGSVTARVDVITPGGEQPQRVELFLNDERMANLTEQPYSQTLRLPGGEPVVVRAVAFLADGTSAEDAVVINSAPFSEAVEVRLVELYALVQGPDGVILSDLEKSDFRVLEDGVPQSITRFEAAGDQPLHVALLVDRSASMEPRLEQVREAAMSFVDRARERPGDEVAVASFADRSSVDAGLGASRGQVERALAGMLAEGRTALYDSVVETLNAFAGVEGQMAVILFTDGRDEISRLSYDQMLERARRAGVTIYTVALGSDYAERDDRRLLEDLAAQTGGEAYFLTDVAGLQATYDRILTALRQRYLLAYQPTVVAEEGEGFRTIEVEVGVRGASVKTRRGRYP